MAKSFVGMNGFNPNEYAKFDNGINVYTCITTENNHALTGNGNNIKFIADAPYNEGDTITVNGETVSAQTQDGQPLQTGVWATGATVVCYLNGTTLNLRGGGGKVTVTGLSANKILEDTTITVKQGEKVISEVTGTMPNNSNKMVVIKNYSQTPGPVNTDGAYQKNGDNIRIIPGIGYWGNFDFTMEYMQINGPDLASLLGLTADKLKSGTKILGVVGTLTPAPESGTFYGYNGAVSYNSINPMLGTLSPGPICIPANTVSGFAAPNRLMLTGGTDITTPTVYWFTNRLDFSKYSSIVIQTNGYPWEGWRTFTFGVGKTTNLNEWLAYTTASIGNGTNKEVVVDVKNVNEFGYIKWQTSNGYSQFITSLAVNV